MKENIGLWKMNQKRWRQLRVPVVAYFELTPRCTLDCKMCYVHLTPAQMGDRKELTTAEWLSITDEAFQAGMIGAVLTGGECMLHPGFWDIYDHLLDRGTILSVNTNAVALTDEDLARFRKRAPAAVRVTLYGASEDGYERLTGRRVFGQVMENLEKLQKTVRLKLALTLTRFNKDEFLDMARLAMKLKIPFNYCFDLEEPDEETNRHCSEFDLSQEELRQIILEVRALSGVPLFQNEPVTKLPPRLPDDPACKGTICGAGRSSYTIRWDGKMVPCFSLRDGVYIQQVGFQAAWEEIKRRTDVLLRPVECETCKLLPACKGCLLVRADPNHPGHCNPKICQETITRYNLGITTLEKTRDPLPVEDGELC